jgi:hypothetical protein
MVVKTRQRKRSGIISVTKEVKSCFFCNKHLTSTNRTTEHIIPVCLGGKNYPPNVVACCYGCNNDRSRPLSYFLTNRFNEEGIQFVRSCYSLFYYRLWKLFEVTSIREFKRLLTSKLYTPYIESNIFKKLYSQPINSKLYREYFDPLA